METNEYVAGLLLEAIDILNESSDEVVVQEEIKEKFDEISDDIKNSKFKEAKSKVIEFKKWYFGSKGVQRTSKPRLRSTLTIINLCAIAISEIITGFCIGTSLSGITRGLSMKNKVVSSKDIKVLIISITALIATGVISVAEDKAYDKYTRPELDTTISFCEKKIKETEKSLKSMSSSDIGYAGLKKALDSYKDTLAWAKFRKKQLEKTDNVTSARQNLKDAKKSKDKEMIKTAKNKLKRAKDAKRKYDDSMYS